MSIQALIFDLFDVLFRADDHTQRRAFEAGLGFPKNGLEEAIQAIAEIQIYLDHT